MKKFLILTIGMLATLTGFVFSEKAYAAPIGNYSINPVNAENQISGTGSYFNLLVKPNQKQSIFTDIQNTSDKPAVFKVSVNPAITSDGGAIDYSKNDAKIDKTVPFDIRDHIKVEKNEYIVPAHSVVRVRANISMPSNVFEGRVIGGLYIQKKVKDEKADKDNPSTAQIRTRIAYTVAIVLQQNQNKIQPDLNYIKTEPATVNDLAVIQMGFRTPTATIIPDLIFTTTVKKDGKKYIENTSNKYQVAPNTNFHVNLGLDGQRVQPGKYTVHVVAKSGPFYKWEFDDKFTIKAEKADIVNKNSVFPEEKGINIWLIITIILATILVGVIIFLLLKRKKDNKEETNE